MRKRIQIAEVPIDNVTYEQVLHRIDDFVQNDRKVYLVTANPEIILNASQNEHFLPILKSSEINTADGVGVLWAASYLSSPLPKSSVLQYLQLLGSLAAILVMPGRKHSVLQERVTGSDLLKRIAETSQEKEWKLFLLGASPGVAKKTKEKFKKKFPKVKIVGTFEGTPQLEDEDLICEKINKAEPDILFVAYGSPAQECWIHRNLFKLPSVKVAIGVGGAFDFYGGNIKRAPKWLQKSGLEWLWRLGRQPKRFSRIWRATAVFVRLVFNEKRKVFEDLPLDFREDEEPLM